MSQPAFAADLEGFFVTRQAADARADDACRLVRVGTRAVTIERTVAGIRMRVGIPVAAYRGLVIAIGTPTGRATLSLRHADSELDVVLGSGAMEEVARSARAWSLVLDKTVVVEDACVVIGAPLARRRKRPGATRRSAFSRRRKPGIAARAATSFAGEDEIIARD